VTCTTSRRGWLRVSAGILTRELTWGAASLRLHQHGPAGAICALCRAVGEGCCRIEQVIGRPFPPYHRAIHEQSPMQMGQFGDERVVVPQLMACQKILKKEKKAFPSRSPPLLRFAVRFCLLASESRGPGHCIPNIACNVEGIQRMGFPPPLHLDYCLSGPQHLYLDSRAPDPNPLPLTLPLAPRIFIADLFAKPRMHT